MSDKRKERVAARVTRKPDTQQPVDKEDQLNNMSNSCGQKNKEYKEACSETFVITV